ncbi:MAG: hypothetical protein ACI4BB_02475 [Coprococcus sp.]
MKVKRLMGAVLLILLMFFLIGCGKEKDTGNEQKDVLVSEIPIDIVSEIAGTVSEQEKTFSMDDEQKKSYKVLLDGCPDQDAVYYLYDITGDGSPELIVGKDAMSVYSFNQGEVMTIGTLTLQNMYLSGQYGLLAFIINDGTYELRQYQYDGEMITEKVFVSASNSADYDNQTADYMKDAKEVTPYELTDRTPFE